MLLFLNNILLHSALLVVGALWVAEVLKRLPAEVRELHSSRDSTRSIAIVAIWLVTALLLTWIGRSVVLVIGRFLVL